MHSAYVNRADLLFPNRCLGCDGPYETEHRLVARRGIDLLWIAAWEFLSVPIPVCKRCKRRRRIVGYTEGVGEVLVIVGGGFLAMILAVEYEQAVLSGALMIAIFAFAAFSRFRRDILIEWHTLGVRMDLLRGEALPLRFSFRRPEYHAAWLAVNPGARATRDPLPQPDMTATPEQDAPAFGRKVPAIFLLVFLGLLALHHWNAVANRETWPVAFLFFSTFGGLAAGGMIYPPLFYSLGKHGKHLPVWVKLLGGLSLAAGFGVGMWTLFTLY